MKTLALDIGGANLKAVHSDGPAHSEPFALWKEPEKLAEKLTTLAAKLPPFDRLAITTTAELCDCFPSKRHGVAHVLDAAESLAAARPISVWLTEGRFADPAEARQKPLLAAAANWHALATALAKRFPHDRSLLIDTGSTTTDIIMLDAARVRAAGLTDLDRLATGELVYLGALRTPLMALGPTIVFRGREHRVMAEFFATTADVYLLLGHLPEDPADLSTADARPMLKTFAAARILRMIGADLEQATPADATRLAQAFAQRAVDRLAQAAWQVLSENENKNEKKGSDPFSPPARIIISGAGSFIAAQAATATLPATPQTSLANLIGPDSSTSACAWALLQLMTA